MLWHRPTATLIVMGIAAQSERHSERDVIPHLMPTSPRPFVPGAAVPQILVIRNLTRTENNLSKPLVAMPRLTGTAVSRMVAAAI
jgi:hypothetical protein